MHLSRILEQIVRTDGRRVLAALIRLTGDFDAAEDALQEAYARALATWRRDGIPENPAYRAALDLVTNPAERRYLERRLNETSG